MIGILCGTVCKKKRGISFSRLATGFRTIATTVFGRWQQAGFFTSQFWELCRCDRIRVIPIGLRRQIASIESCRVELSELCASGRLSWTFNLALRQTLFDGSVVCDGDTWRPATAGSFHRDGIKAKRFQFRHKLVNITVGHQDAFGSRGNNCRKKFLMVGVVRQRKPPVDSPGITSIWQHHPSGCKGCRKMAEMGKTLCPAGRGGWRINDRPHSSVVIPAFGVRVAGSGTPLWRYN